MNNIDDRITIKKGELKMIKDTSVKSSTIEDMKIKFEELKKDLEKFSESSNEEKNKSQNNR